MNSAELKISIINKIMKINDNTLLSDIYKLLDFKSDEEVYELPPEVIEVINETRKQYKKGEYLSEEEANEETEKNNLA